MKRCCFVFSFVGCLLLFVPVAFAGPFSQDPGDGCGISNDDPFCPNDTDDGGSGGTGGGSGTASCTVTTNCSGGAGGSVSCTSFKNDCKRGSDSGGWVKCDGVKTCCTPTPC